MCIEILKITGSLPRELSRSWLLPYYLEPWTRPQVEELRIGPPKGPFHYTQRQKTKSVAFWKRALAQRAVQARLVEAAELSWLNTFFQESSIKEDTTLFLFRANPRTAKSKSRISALPKGLISWFLGRPISTGIAPGGCRSRSHQLIAASPFSDILRPMGSFLGYAATQHLRPSILKGWYLSSVLERKLERCSQGFDEPLDLMEPSTKRIGTSRLPRFVFTEDFPRVKVALKPSDEGSLSRLRNPNLKDRKVRWNARRCYKVHPYWTDNLKYVY